MDGELGVLILQTDPELAEWVLNLDRLHAGGFLSAIGIAAQRADFQNYPLMRPLLISLKRKYPEYAGEPTLDAH
jgi:hypothetical protein